jgi:hypothetical protein
VGQWLATVRFPDGTSKYATHSTVTESLLCGLYSRMCPLGGTLPDGSECYRAQVTGDPDPVFPDVAPILADELVPVVISVEPDAVTWHALFCPRRQLLLGPPHYHHAIDLQERFELVPDSDAVRHLRPVDAVALPGQPPSAACGRPVPGPPLPFNTPWRSDGGIGYEDGPRVDLFADWNRGDVCRDCLLSQLPEADGDDPPPHPALPLPGLAVRIRSWLSAALRH